MYLSQTDVNALTDAQIDGILFSGLNETVYKSNFAILCGTSPEHVRIRTDIAFKYYKNGGAPYIVLSGSAVADKTVRESSAMYRQLIKAGVPDEALITEPCACDTIQNMTCSLTAVCKRTDIMEAESIAVITEPFHLRRALAVAKLLLPAFINVFGYTSGVREQRILRRTDERLKKCVRNEIKILKDLISKGRIQDIEIK